MAFTMDGGRTGGSRSRRDRTQPAEVSDWAEPEPQPRDWKKLFLVAGLGILSWVATYVGMLELIEANVGDLPLAHRVIIAFSVAMLMTMIIWLLDQMFAPIGFLTKTLYIAGYLFLTIISVGFGFGFYWKVLESKGEGTRVAETAISQVQAPLQTAAVRLETLQRTLDQLKATSQQKAEQERAQGTSCPNSRPGDGPRRKLREDDAARFSFASDFVKGRIDGVKVDIGTLDADLIRITKDDRSIVDAKTGTRNEFMRAMNRKLDSTVTNFNAFRGDAQLKQIRTELADRADKTQFPDTQGKTYSCPDPGLQTMIRSVVASIDALPVLDKPKIATVEGSDATIEAFRRLTASFYGLISLKLPPSAEELRELQKRAVQSIEAGASGQRHGAVTAEQAGLSKRDYVPLAIAIFVDICLLLVSMGRPMNRLQNLLPKMRQAERGPVYQILSRFTEIHRDPDIRQNFEIFRHVVFDFNGAYYVAIPLDAPPRANPGERRELQLEAHLLANLFASFEQEKIFSRVYAPLLTVKAIQKKLWRQGSKFAHSEAFRIYKFRDGAWSDIILGAVMGAARRVEAEKRRQRMADAEFRAENPTLPLPQRAPFSQANVFPFPPPGVAPRAPAMAPPPPSRRPAEAELEAQYGPYAQFQGFPGPTHTPERRAVPMPSAAPVVPPSAATAATAQVAAATAMQAAPQPVAPGASGADRFVPEALVAVVPANSNTAPSAFAQAQQPIATLEQAAAEANGVDVEMTERTMRFTVPNSEAALPAALRRHLAAASEVTITAHGDAGEEPERIAPVDGSDTNRGVNGTATDVALLATRLRPSAS